LKEGNYRYNASRLYGGYAPAHPDKPKTDYEPSTKLAMPEEWYKEVKEAYDVITPSGKQGRSLMEIFHSVGFTGGETTMGIRTATSMSLSGPLIYL